MTENPADILGKIKVPSGMVNAQAFVAYLQQFAEQGKQIGAEDLDTYLGLLSATVMDIVHTMGVQQSAADNLKQSFKGLFKPKPESE